MQNWTRSQYFDETGLPWTNPSPNLRSVAAPSSTPAWRCSNHQHLRRPRHRHALRAHRRSLLDAAHSPPTSPSAISPVSPLRPPPSPSPKTQTTTPLTARPSPAIAFTLTDRNVLDSPELGIELISALQHLLSGVHPGEVRPPRRQRRHHARAPTRRSAQDR